MLIFKRFLLVTAVLCCFGSSAFAATSQLMGTFRDWTLNRSEDGNDVVCFIATEPQDTDGNFSRRGTAVVYVSKFPTQPPKVEVSVRSGYRYIDAEAIEVKVDGQPFQFFAQGETAWPQSVSVDESIITAMKKGRKMTVRGTSPKRTYSLDTYSLLGFTAAFNALRDACN